MIPVSIWKTSSIMPLRRYVSRPDSAQVYNIAIAHAPQLLLAVQEALKAFPDPPSPL